MNTPTRIVVPLVLLLAISAATAEEGRVVAGRYHSEREWFSVPVPTASNWAGVPFVVRGASVNKDGVGDFDTVMFAVGDFGEALIASVRRIPEPALAAMKEQPERTVLSSLAEKALHDWRDAYPRSLRFPTEPRVMEDTFINTPYGEAILRVYLAENGSLIRRAAGRRPTSGDSFDTLIAVIAARQRDRFVSAIAENDAQSDDKEGLKKRVQSFFSGITLPDPGATAAPE